MSDCDPMNHSMPSFPVLQYLLESAQTHVHWVSDAIQLVISSSVTPFSSCLQSFPASGSFPMSWFFTLCGQSIGASASASVLPMNIKGWFSLGLTSLISLLSKGLSRVLQHHRTLKSPPAPQLKSINSSVLSLIYGTSLTSIHDHWKTRNFDSMDLC